MTLCVYERREMKSTTKSKDCSQETALWKDSTKRLCSQQTVARCVHVYMRAVFTVRSAL